MADDIISAGLTVSTIQLESKIYPDTTSGKGEDGFSPKIDVAEISGGHRVTVTDVDGTKSFDVMDGVDGLSGVSPAIAVSEISGGHRVTITDASGAKSFDVMDGAGGSGAGDMLASTYDPAGGKKQVAFQADLSSHTSNSTVHITSSERATWNAKQSKLTGTKGQIVGFDASGNAVAQAAPSSGGGGMESCYFEYVIPASAWSAGANGGYIASIDLGDEGFPNIQNRYDVPLDIDCSPLGTNGSINSVEEDPDAYKEILYAWSLIDVCNINDTLLELFCLSAQPEVDIPVIIRYFA